MDFFLSKESEKVADYLKSLGLNIYPFGDNYYYFGYEKDDTFGFICENKDNIVVRFIYVDLLSNKPSIDTFNWDKEKFTKKIYDITKIYHRNKKYHKLEAIKHIADQEFIPDHLDDTPILN